MRMIRASADLLMTTSLSTRPELTPRQPLRVLNLEHHSRIDLVIAGEYRFEGGVKLLNTKFRQVAEAAVIDARARAGRGRRSA